MTPSARSPITAQVSSLPATYRSAQKLVAVGPILAPDLLRRMRAVLLDDDDAERRALARPASARKAARSTWRRAASWRSTVTPSATGTPAAREHRLGAVLLHGERRGEHAGMGVRNSQDLEQTLDRAVLADRAMQRVEGDVGLQREQHFGDVAADIDARDAIAARLQRVGAALSRN